MPVRILCQPPSGGYGEQDWCTATLETCTTGLACWWMAGECSWDCDKASFTPYLHGFFLSFLVGGLYANTQAPQGKEGSATDVMAAAKLKLTNEGKYWGT